MIRRIYSSLPGFKNLEFRPGLNVLLADKSPGASDRQTRNRAGKSSLTEIVHLLAGATIDKGSLFSKDNLVEATFGMEWDIAGKRTAAERSGSRRNRVYVVGDDTSTWPLTPTLDRQDQRPSLNITQWRNALGQLVFGLSQEVQGQSWGPKFRSLFSYFVRRESAGAFRSPVKQSVLQQTGDQQVALTFLLGLDWTIPQQLQHVRERERTLRELRRAARGGALGSIIGSAAQIRTSLTVTEERVRLHSQQLERFQVLPQYRDYETEASELTRQISSLNDDNTMDRQFVAQLEVAINRETAPPMADVERVYEEIGVSLPSTVLRRFEEVREFHNSVISNRQSYLEGELEATRNRISERERNKEQLDHRRSELMGILQTHGALEHFGNLQAELTRLRTEVENLRHQYETAEHLDSQTTELDANRSRLYQRLRQDFDEQQQAVKSAILSFERVSSQLYEEAGRLTLTETMNGPEFEVTIQGARSAGINKMQIFCFDMMLMIMSQETQVGPGFLIHDSHLFDGVDERQIARGLQQGARIAKEFDFQYIVTMNSDDLPPGSLFEGNFNISDYIMPLRLTDQTEEGGLFGFRFD